MVTEPESHAEKHQKAQDEYIYARKRFVTAVLGSAEVARLVKDATEKRDKLRAEIENLRLLAKDRHEASLRDARAYAAILPHRVKKNGELVPPATLEKMGGTHGAEQRYKAALRSSKEYIEARDLYVKRRSQLATVEQGLLKTLHDREMAIERQLDTLGGHDVALQRDPLLNKAYKKLIAVEAELADHLAEPLPQIP
jgi:ABC-type transporter lipoprotein component MlaA